LAAFYLEETMTSNSTSPKRTVVPSIQTIDNDQPQPNRSRSASAGTIIAIQVTVDDGTQVTEYNISKRSEMDLLREFWNVVRPQDVFVGYGIAKDLAVLRQRSWEVGLIPSFEIDLRIVYQHKTLDPASLREMTGGTEYGSAEALLCLFGLPVNIPDDKTTAEFQVTNARSKITA
jgi:hypothetical protein